MTLDILQHRRNRSEFCRIPAEGGEPQKICDGWIMQYSLQDGWLYLVGSEQEAIIRMRPDGSESSEIYRSDFVINACAVTADKLVVSLCKETTTAESRIRPT